MQTLENSPQQKWSKPQEPSLQKIFLLRISEVKKFSILPLNMRNHSLYVKFFPKIFWGKILHRVSDSSYLTAGSKIFLLRKSLIKKFSIRRVPVAQTIFAGGSFLEFALSVLNFFFCSKLRNNIFYPGKIKFCPFRSYLQKYSKKTCFLRLRPFLKPL